MIKTSMQVKALVRNHTHGDSDKAAILIRLFMMERLIERISVSKYRDQFIFKGGILVASLVGISSRTTMDLDTTVRSISLEVENITSVLEELFEIDLKDNVRFRITNTMPIMEGHEYEGVRFYIEVKLDKMRQLIKMDVSTGDVITPDAVYYDYKMLLDGRRVKVKTYNLETELAEKLETIMVRSVLNSRARDFYDIHMLLKKHGDSIDYDLLYEAFVRTCTHRAPESLIPEIENIFDKVKTSPLILKTWDEYSKKFDYVRDVTWEEVFASVNHLKNLMMSHKEDELKLAS